MILTVKNKIEITGADAKTSKALKAGLSLPNPLYDRLRRMGNSRALYAVPKFFKYYEEDKQTGALQIGRGCEKALEDYCEKAGVSFTVKDQTYAPEASLKSKIKLRDYQRGIPEEVIGRGRNGIIRLGTGFGKSLIALRIAELLGLRTLILVPRSHLKEQFAADIKHYFGFTPGDLAETGDDHAPISVSTVQAARLHVSRLVPRARAELAARYGLVIADEAHGMVPKKTREVVEAFAPRYLYGMTATPRRTDKQDKAIEFTFGPILVSGDMPRETPSVEIYEFRGDIPVWEYAEIIEAQVQNAKRNELIASLIQEEVSQGRRVLVLTKRIEHYERLSLALSARDVEAIKLESKGSAKSRAHALNSLRTLERDFSCLIGTFSLLGTGVDIPALDTLVIAGDLKSDVLAEQSTGRILRLFEGKQSPKIIDIMDAGNPILLRQAKERQRFYKGQNWPMSYGPRSASENTESMDFS